MHEADQFLRGETKADEKNQQEKLLIRQVKQIQYKTKQKSPVNAEPAGGSKNYSIDDNSTIIRVKHKPK